MSDEHNHWQAVPALVAGHTFARDESGVDQEVCIILNWGLPPYSGSSLRPHTILSSVGAAVHNRKAVVTITNSLLPAGSRFYRLDVKM